jgi:hypothetical protein
VTILFHSFKGYGRVTDGTLHLTDVMKWTPESFVALMADRDERQGMVGLQGNKIYAHEVAAKLIDEKRQELKGGSSWEDIFSLLGTSTM